MLFFGWRTLLWREFGHWVNMWWSICLYILRPHAITARNDFLMDKISHKFQVDIPALGAKYILSGRWNHISFSRFIRGTAFSCRITDLREISNTMRQTSKLNYVLLKELETMLWRTDNRFTHFILDRSFLLWLTLKVGDWYLRSARHSREALYSTESSDNELQHPHCDRLKSPLS